MLAQQEPEFTSEIPYRQHCKDCFIYLVLQTVKQVLFGFFFQESCTVFHTIFNELSLFCFAVHATGRVTALYGDIIVIPCNDGASVPEDLMFIKWKYVSIY